MSKINVTQEVLNSVILGIYYDLKIPVDGRLTASHLEEEFKKTGLRDSDLVEGIDQLLADHMLELQVVEDTPTLKLTQYGADYVNNNLRFKSIMKDLKTRRILNITRKRVGKPRSVTPEEERRMDAAAATS